jgi:DNA transposition AAA+ family ATPase
MNELSIADIPGRTAQLSNMALALKTALDLEEARSLSSRIGLLYGPSGYGKTYAAVAVAAELNAVYIRAGSTWTSLTLLKHLAAEVGILKPARTAPDILQQVVDELRVRERLVVIDEMDFLVKAQRVEIIRDILDETRIGVLMIGEESLPAKLKEWERVDNRVLVATAAQPASEADALMLRDHYVTRVVIADDLVLYFREACHGVTRRIVGNLMAAQRFAIDNGHAVLDRKLWGSRPVETGAVPIRRRSH